jgi:cell wall-associated NlpC family hydrolase
VDRRWRGLTAAVASLAATLGLLLAGMPTAAADHHTPSAREVAAGKAAVHQRERQVARAAARLASAQQRMDRLSTVAEVAVEAYDEARVKQQAAAQAVQAAELVLTTASARVDTARDRVARFVSAAYMSGGMTTVDAMLSADGPETLLSRVGTLQVISKAQRDATQELDAARVYQVSVEMQAQAVLDRAQKAATVAAQARAHAQQAVSRQTTVLRGVQQQRHQLNVLLARAKRHASAIERQRLAALAAARAAAAARAVARAAQQSVGPVTSTGAVGDVPGTASAATEQQAVSYAESQIGKPYVWGGAGPDTYDCSGLVMWAYAHAGVNLDHWTGFQWQEGARMAISSLRPGDLVFFATNTSDPNTIHHVGMYIGNGEMVEAPHTGAFVRISSIWRPDLIGAVRPYQR